MVDHTAGRNARLISALKSAAISKGATMLSSVLTVPLVIRHLGAQEFGIWSTITATLTMLLALDLGIASSLTNFISEAYARADPGHASRYTTNALALTSVIGVATGLGVTLLWPYISWATIFGLRSSDNSNLVSQAVAAGLALFLLDIPCRLGAKILGGYQELRTANIFAALGAVGNLLVIAFMVRLNAKLPIMVVGSSAATVAADALCLLWTILLHKPWLRPKAEHLDSATARRIIGLGTNLFLLQIAGLLVFDSDNLIITHFLGPAAVAPYNLTWRLINYAIAAQSMVMTALWPAFSEAFERRDTAWVRHTFWRTMQISMAIALIIAIFLAMVGKQIIQLWASSEATPSHALMLLMCAWLILGAFMNNTVTVLLARGTIKLQARLSVAVGIFNLPLSIYLVKQLGSIGAILATILAYLVILAIPQSVIAWKLLRCSKPITTVT